MAKKVKQAEAFAGSLTEAPRVPSNQELTLPAIAQAVENLRRQLTIDPNTTKSLVDRVAALENRLANPNASADLVKEVARLGRQLDLLVEKYFSSDKVPNV